MSIRESLIVLNIPLTAPLSPLLLKSAFAKRALELHPDTTARQEEQQHEDVPRRVVSDDFRRLSVARKTIAEALSVHNRSPLPSSPDGGDFGPTGLSLDDSLSSSFPFSSGFAPRRSSSLEDYAAFASLMGASANGELLKAERAFRRGHAVVRRSLNEGLGRGAAAAAADDQQADGGSRAPRSRVADLADRLKDPWQTRENLKKSLDRAYFGPKLPWEGSNRESSIHDWPCAFECEQRSSKSASLSKEKSQEPDSSSSSSSSSADSSSSIPENSVPVPRPTASSLPSSFSSVDNVLELVVGRHLLGFVRQEQVGGDPSSPSHSSLSLFYRSGVLATCERVAERRGNTLRRLIRIKCPLGKTLHTIVDDGGRAVPGSEGETSASFFDDVPFFNKFRNVVKKRRICRVLSGDGANDVESHVLQFFTTPGVQHLYVVANDGKKGGDGGALQEDRRSPFSRLGDINPDGKSFGRVESKVTLAAMLPRSMWLWDARNETHTRGSFLFERVTKKSRKHAIDVDFDKTMDGWFDGTGSSPKFGEQEDGEATQQTGEKKRGVLHPAVLTLFVALMCQEKEYDDDNKESSCRQVASKVLSVYTFVKTKLRCGG